MVHSKMGIPVKNQESSCSSTSASSPVNHSSYYADANVNGNSNSSNGVNSSHSSSGAPSYIFLYGNSRPDAPNNTQSLPGLQNKRAWLLGSRLYSFSTGGVSRAAVKLEESGHAVLGYAVSTNDSMGITRLLDEFERREYFPDLYERDIVEVISERGERLQSYIYHRPDVNPSNLIPTGDWLRQ